jgi:hypothetical protein
MKTILIVAERIGVDETAEQDSKIVDIVREMADENIIHVYARSIVLNDAGDYLRMKGVELHTQAVTMVINMPHKYDAIIAFDMWGMKNSGLFEATKKIRITKDSTSLKISQAINKK